MDNTFDIIYATRKNFLKLTDGLNLQQLNMVPQGFNNNIAWNLGHIVVTQQALCYERAGQTGKIDQELVEQYRKGSKPVNWINREELGFFQERMFTGLEELKKDLEAGFFEKKRYEKLVTSYGTELSNLPDAIRYMATHDALHYGYSLALKRLVQAIEN